MDYCISPTFDKKIELLCKRKKFGYFNCKIDIVAEFKDCLFDQLWNIKSGDALLRSYPPNEKPIIKLVKGRIPNSSMNVGKTPGYRLYYIIHKKFKTITFIYIHPKMGNLNEDDKGDKDFDNMLSNYLDELKNKTIKKIDLKKFPKSD